MAEKTLEDHPLLGDIVSAFEENLDLNESSEKKDAPAPPSSPASDGRGLGLFEALSNDTNPVGGVTPFPGEQLLDTDPELLNEGQTLNDDGTNELGATKGVEDSAISNEDFRTKHGIDFPMGPANKKSKTLADKAKLAKVAKEGALSTNKKGRKPKANSVSRTPMELAKTGDSAQQWLAVIDREKTLACFKATGHAGKEVVGALRSITLQTLEMGTSGMLQVCQKAAGGGLWTQYAFFQRYVK